MKIILLLLFTLSIQCIGQNIYQADSRSQASVVVYVTDNRSQADLVVYESSSLPYGNEGLWFFTDNRARAKNYVYFVSNRSQADLVIYMTNNRSQAGWINSSKKHLIK